MSAEDNMRRLGAILPPEANDIPLSHILDQLINKAYANLINLCDTLPNLSIVNRKSTILQYSVNARELFVKLLVLVRSAHNSAHVLQIQVAITLYFILQHLLAWITKLDASFAFASDMLYGMHRDLKAARFAFHD
jgi:hypothetical protein